MKRRGPVCCVKRKYVGKCSRTVIQWKISATNVKNIKILVARTGGECRYVKWYSAGASAAVMKGKRLWWKMWKSVCVCVARRKTRFLNEVFRAKWSERLDTFGLEICPITYVKIAFENISNGNNPVFLGYYFLFFPTAGNFGIIVARASVCFQFYVFFLLLQVVLGCYIT